MPNRPSAPSSNSTRTTRWRRARSTGSARPITPAPAISMPPPSSPRATSAIPRAPRRPKSCSSSAWRSATPTRSRTPASPLPSSTMTSRGPAPRSRSARPPRRSASAAPDPAVSPLGDAEFAAAMAALGGFEPAPRLAVAVSGGPDSLALAILAERWARARGGGVTALVVDHGLRPDSAAEARRVGAWLAARGIAHALLEWRGPKPATGIQEAARAARYALLAEWCRAHRHLHLLTAHHRDDQAETVLIRRRAGSGPDGLAGMPAVRELAGCRLLRPLLGIAKPRLAALLDALGQDFVRDPSNADPAFERARLRLAGAPAAAAAALAEARGFARARTAREAAFAAAAARQVALYPAGFAVVAAAAGAELLGRLAHTVGGAPYPPRRERVARLHESLAARPDRARTLGGCRFVPWR